MTLEIIVFVLAILFGIVWYWRESKSNKLYRLANKITHSRELQMKPEDQKGFVHRQAFLLRLVWVTLLFSLGAAVVTFVTPINMFFVQYFASAIVGTLIGTYVASAFILAKDGASRENLEKAFDKGRELLEDLAEGDEKEAPAQKIGDAPEAGKIEAGADPPKSARDRLKDKGMIK